MEYLNLDVSIALMAPLLMMLIVLRGRARRILGFAVAGIYVCLLSGEINALILNSFGVSGEYFTENISPIIEEVLKAIPIFVYVFAFKPDKQSNIECAIAIGVGFALMENVITLINYADDIDLVLVLFRGFGAGMMHGMTTLLIGLGADIVIRKKRLIVPGTLAALAAASIYHSIYNTIIQSQFHYFGFLLPLLTFIPILIILNKQLFRITRSDEVF